PQGVQYNARWCFERTSPKEASIVSENTALQEGTETQREEVSTQVVEAPRSAEAPQEAPAAETNERTESDGASTSSSADEDSQPAEQVEAPAVEQATSESSAGGSAESTAETAPSAEAQPAGAGEPAKPKKRRRRRRRKPRAAALPPVEIKVIPRKKIVKPLKRGMELEGTVRRLAEFGAFVDIGVGTDGLVHISELSPTRVRKVSDVVQEGQRVKVWIKDLNKAENRISLTMIPPGTKTIRNLEEGEIVQGTVTRLTSYGAFVDIGVGRDAMLHVREMANGYVAKPEDVVHVGEELEARVIAVDRRRQRIDLSLKGLRPEPELKPVREDSYSRDEDDEIPSIMAVAFQKALGEDFEIPSRRNRRPKRRRRRRDDYDDELEEVLSRTLRYRGNRM
ncbi:MAG: S1 RNA-binding domain-containing protein, partial [Anaerolineae bacterium]|nr:S1 RNA-binding domain-containing protein [Anaerolineae bacterium]